MKVCREFLAVVLRHARKSPSSFECDEDCELDHLDEYDVERIAEALDAADGDE